MNDKITYLSEIEYALHELGGMGSLQEINLIIESRNLLPAITSNRNWKDNVRATIQRHCSATRSYNGAEDVFYSVYGLGEGYWGLNSSKSLNIADEINPIEQRKIDSVIKSNNLSSTEKQSIILSRRGQGEFRKKIINKYKKCIVTGISDKRLLVASHIKPWRNADNIERLSEDNGFLLSPLYDKLFDIGLITFTTDGRIMMSCKISNEDKMIIAIDESYKYLKDISIDLIHNIEYHNDVIFIK